MKSKSVHIILITSLLAIVSSYIVYFGYTTNYTIHAFSPTSFKNQYDHDVYKYRILSKKLLLFTDKALKDVYPDDKAEIRLTFMDKIASERFYYAYFYVNTFFLVLVSVILALLLETERSITMSNNEKYLILFLVPILICLTQYVVCPYDISGYFFQLLTIFIYLRYFDRYYIVSLLLICFLLILATLNRESSALTAAFLMILTLCKLGMTKKSIIFSSLVAATFFITYFALRYFIVETNGIRGIHRDYLFFNLFFFQNNLGIIFWITFFYLSVIIANSRDNKIIIIIFHIVSLPYIWTCFSAGILWETRLYVPLFLGSLCFGKLNISNFKFHPWAYLQTTKIYKALQ